MRHGLDMPLTILKGNLFTSNAQTLVNSVNCVGVMGAGVAFEFRLRYPEMFARYRNLCKKGQIAVGSLWLFKARSRWVLNLPTKTDWKLPSKPKYLELGLVRFLRTYEETGITSVAFPVLGAGKGGLPEHQSLELMKLHLRECPINVEIYRYDPTAPDDLYIDFRLRLASLSDSDVLIATGIRSREIVALRRALKQSSYQTLSQLLAAPGVGETTLERCFRFVTAHGSFGASGQLGLNI
jgi:O-acetyl-ADP-ribose deacetylase (regulator of RNase III)